MNIVIADDEEIILKWMKKNIEMMFPEHNVIDTCSNGKQVLNCCFNKKVDVLFTDIRMPIMDGMELLKKLNDNQILPYTIILSAYDDFSYARECLKLGVREFLLKSEITREELEKCLQAAVDFLKSKEDSNQKIYTKEEQLKCLLQHVFQKDVISAESLSQEWDKVWGKEKLFTVIILYSEDKMLNMEQVEEVADFLFQEADLKYYCIPKSEKKTVILVEIPRKSLYDLTLEVYRTFSSFGCKYVSVNAGGIGCLYSDVEDVYKQAEDVMFYNCFYEETGGLDYETMRRIQKENTPKMELVFREIEKKMNEHDWMEIIAMLQQAFCQIREFMPDVTVIRNFILQLILNVYWNYLGEAERKKFSIDDFISISNCKKIDELERKVLFQMDQFLALLMGQQPVYSEAVCKIIKYIEENYAENISLEELANYVHMNRSYISHLFKKETESNIYTYLLNVRLEKAKKLLVETKDNIQEICYLVGIPDSAYFSKVFKKNTGMTPLEYRKIK